MKAQTALALFVVFVGVFLFLGFYAYGDHGGSVCGDGYCDTVDGEGCDSCPGDCGDCAGGSSPTTPSTTDTVTGSGSPPTCTSPGGSCATGTCRWNVCADATNQITYTFDTGGVCVAPAQRSGNRWVTAPQCTTNPFALPMPANYKPECLHTVTVTVAADDSGQLRFGGPSDATEYFSFGTSAARDITNKIKANPSLQLSVIDTAPAQRSGETTRSISAKFDIIVLNPSPTQKCIAGPSGKPILAPLCAGTDAECTQTPTENASITAPRCIATQTLDRWVAKSTSMKCVNGNYRANVTLLEHQKYSCGKEVLDQAFSLYGSYNTSGFVINETKDNWTTRTLCPGGCLNGACRTVPGPGPGPGPGPCLPGSREPTLTSITAAPRRIALNGTIKMTSVASDPDTITNGSTSRRQKIKLLCGTDEGNVHVGPGQGCTPTGGTPASPTGGGGGGQNVPDRIDVVSAVDARNPGWIAADSTAFSDAVCRELVRATGDSNWGRKARQRDDEGSRNSDVVAYLLDPNDRGKKVLVDIVSGSDAPGASPAWQSYPGPNVGNGFWIPCPSGSEPVTGLAVARGVTGLVAGDCNSVGSARVEGFGNLRDCSINTVKYKAGRVFSNFNTPQITSNVITKLNEAGLQATLESGCDKDIITFGVTENGAAVGRKDVIRNVNDQTGVGEAWQWLGPSPDSCTGGNGTPGGSGFNANLCSGDLADNNPNCTIRVPEDWRSGGQKNIFCRVQDESGLYSNVSRTSVIIDNIPPTSTITAPAANSVQNGNFPATVSDVDESGLDKCYYTTNTSDAPTPALLPGVQRPPVGTCEWAYANGVNTNDPPSIEGECRGVLWGGIRNINTALGCSQNFTYNGVPASEWVSWRNYAQAVVDVCNTFPGNYVISREQLAALQNVLGPLRSTCPASSKGIACVCSPDPNDPLCGQFVPLIGGIPSRNTASLAPGAKNRTCNSQFTVEVGEGKDCQPQGTCSVSVFARDTNGNVGSPDSRSFLIKSLFTNITSPPAGSYQGSNFTVTVQDRSYTNATNLTCTYSIFSIGSSSMQTVDNSARQCNSNFTVSVGQNEDCRNLGQNTCRVVSKVNATLNGTAAGDSSERFYSIDWNMPVSNITASPSGWVNSDFTISVVDYPWQTQITECQYRVVSNGTETVRWTNRSCGVGSPVQLTITAGNSSSKNCRHEGGEACQVFVRPLGRGRTPGIGDNASVSVVFGNIDTNGFHLPLGALTTNRGVNFSGTTRTELRAATFYACNSRSSVNSCIAAYTNGNRGPNSNNYCGSITSRCELRCSDRDVSFYFAARGVPIGTSEILTVMSPIRNAPCPVFNIAEINRMLGIFRQLDQDISIQIMEIDTFISQNGESDTANNETLDVLNDALLLTKDHLNYMNVTMQDLTVAKSQQIIARSNSVLAEINAILRGIQPPARVRLTVNMPPTVRFNRSSMLPAVVTKTGPRAAYARIYCDIASPRNITRERSGCLALGPTTNHDMSFFPNILGPWQYSCTLGRSVRSDCSFEVNQTPVTGTFTSLPGFGTYIDSISAPSTVLRGQSAVVTATIRNPDEVQKFATVRCDFTDPLTGVRRNSSSCTQLDASGTSTAQVRMIADRLGNWTANRCQISASEFSGCAGAVVDNISRASANYSVILPDDVFIESVTIPQSPVINGSSLSIVALVNNPKSTSAYVTVSCQLQNPPLLMTPSDRKGMEDGASGAFTLRFDANTTGIWTVNSCTAYKSTNPDFSGSVPVFTVNNLGTFSVISGNNLTITGVSFAPDVANNSLASIDVSVRNPSVTRFGRVTCIFKDPLNLQYANSSSCFQANGGSTTTEPVRIFVNRRGTWNIESCSAFGSLSADCSAAALHSRRSPIGPFNSSGAVTCMTCSNLTNISIVSVSVPANDVMNNTNANIDVLVANPLNDDRFVSARCSVRDPFGVLRLAASSCEGIQAQQTKTYTSSIFVNLTGRWNVTTCSINVSTSCASAAQQQIVNVSRTFNAVRGLNLSFISFVPPDDTLAGNIATTGVSVRNPSDAARFARVTCSFRTPNNQLVSNSTACLEIGGTAVSAFGVSIFANAVGTWSVADCALRGSLTPDCANLQDSESNIGSFNVAASAAPVINLFAATPSSINIGGSVNLSWSTSGADSATIDQDIGPVPVSGSVIVTPFMNTTYTFTAPNSRGFASRSANVTVNITAANLSVVNIVSVSVPAGNVINNSNVNIRVLASNPINDDRFAYVSCFVKDPTNATQLVISSCEGIEASSLHTYMATVFANVAGKWNVTSCGINASTSCASATQQHSVNTSKIFNVMRGINLSFVSFTLPGDLQTGGTATTTAAIRNPSDVTRFARVLCSFRTPNNQLLPNSTSCVPVGGTSVQNFDVNIAADVPGTWRVDTCTIRASLSSDCADLHDSRSNIGAFNVTALPPPSRFSELFIQNISVPQTALNNSQIGVVVFARNPNLANSSYANVGCYFTIAGAATRQTSSCLQLTANTTQQFILAQLVNRHGTWTVRDCSINASNTNNCSPSALHNVSQEVKTFNVTLPSDLYITNVAAQNEAVNNSNVPVDVFVNNPLNDDRYGSINCLIENPNGATQSMPAPCSIITRLNSKRYNVSVFANVVGTWNVRNCSVSAASNSACSSSAVTSSMINGDIFRVIRGYNLTISSLVTTSPAYTSTPVFASYTLRNPSASERFGRVTCTFTRSGQSIVNRSSCFTLPPESFADSRANLTTEIAGTWTVTCSAERATDGACSSVELHDSASRAFDVSNPPDLYIQSYDMPALAPLNNLSVAILKIRNQALTPFYGFAGCTFKNRLNETFRNMSQCEEMSGDTTNVAVGVIPELRGNWSVSGCFVNASRNAGCSLNRTHNISTVSKSFSVTAPLLAIEDVYLTSENLFVGDIADITVNVKNIGEREYTSFVNCTIFNPFNSSIKLTTANQTIPLGETRAFHPQYAVDTPGRWRVSTCSAYRLGSIILEDSENVNKPFNVTYTPSQEECNNNVPCEAGFACENNICVQEQPRCSVSNCPGIKDACFCSNNQCVACGDGYACSSGRCAPEIQVNVCNSNSQCPSDQICLNSVCQPRPPECFANSDCPSGECNNNRCVTPSSEPIFSRDIMVLLIIIIAVIMVPLILFIYIKRSL